MSRKHKSKLVVVLGDYNNKAEDIDAGQITRNVEEVIFMKG